MARSTDTKERLLEAALDLIWERSYGATSVDAICERAGVKKGSFYHFFTSKSELSVAAIEASWQQKRDELDKIFSPMVPPLERFERMHEAGLAEQEQLFESKGYVCGCALFALGSEMGTSDQAIRQKVEEILGYFLRYYESAIRDAHAAGLVEAEDPAAKARILFAYVEGMLTQARIMNDLGPIRELITGVFDILGVRRKTLGAA
ncbi:MAG: TetR/AcrR family transcriptional regulator [Verrucomicrobiales bacterium]